MIYETDDYRSFIKTSLGDGRNGSVKKLSEFLRCHSTYVSQVANGKAHFSNEQAIGFSHYLKMNPEETEFFVNLVSRDKAGTPEAKDYFASILSRLRLEREDLHKRWKLVQKLDLEQSLKYYETWIPQVVHIMSQIEDFNSVEKISFSLNIDSDKIFQVVSFLESFGVLKQENGKLVCMIDSIHLEKKSPLHAKFLANWRFKAIEDLSNQKDSHAINYSSVVSLSHEAYIEIKQLILKHLDETRDIIIPSKSEKLCIYNLDFYALT